MVVWPDRTDQRGGAMFQLRIGIAVDKADTQPLAFGRKKLFSCGDDGIFIQRRFNRSICKDTPANADTQLARDHRRVPAPKTPGMGPVAPAHFQHILEPGRGDQSGARSLAFQKRVGTNRGAMHNGGNITKVRQFPANPVHQPDRLVGNGAWHLAGGYGAG
ncbi:MAG: Uncharacterised protein [SAR116 cluster bacterium]|nr:MAG: Uncharacterised protein [SAR116 cluster bacterium]